MTLHRVSAEPSANLATRCACVIACAGAHRTGVRARTGQHQQNRKSAHVFGRDLTYRLLLSRYAVDLRLERGHRAVLRGCCGAGRAAGVRIGRSGGAAVEQLLGELGQLHAWVLSVGQH
jgi:hypothetical protein